MYNRATEESKFKKSDNKAVLNSDLWRQLLSLTRQHKVEFIKVKGHADNVYNNLCDKLATEAVKNFKSGL